MPFDNKWGLTPEEIEIITEGDLEPPPIINPTLSDLSSRAIRRGHRQRKVAEARKVLRSMWGEDKAQHAPLWADNLQKCSCHMCCNPRRNPFLKGKDRLSLAEQKSEADFKLQLKEFFQQ